ncbi:MAG TPA: tRNA (N(6)-L-threonylcarbamoyladenosine(37)-C(2))-methylthiotransferase MtaB, partial [Rhizobiales bacterium]|nr:tRNA (N(6)-L-threonylcarbamoyladenosine(37)-C(2))-methylthiotransferase MtaB [Hyphomicrobiales bacterium]
MNAPEFHSFGCRLNAAETRIMQSQARESDSGNTIVFNTCAVTSEAVRQARQAIRKAHRA